jgi:hypothetical protein
MAKRKDGVRSKNGQHRKKSRTAKRNVP